MHNVLLWILLAFCGVFSESVFPAIQTRQAFPFIIRYPASAEKTVPKTLQFLNEMVNDWHHRLPLGEDPVTVILCSTEVEFRQFAGLYGRRGVQGIAVPSESVIVVKTPELLNDLTTFRNTLRHELAHILLYRNFACDQMPRWLNEGLAMELAGEKRWHSVARVAQAYLRGQMLSYREMEEAFDQPGSETEFGDAYAHALLLTRYLKNVTGETEFWGILNDLHTLSFGDALRKWIQVSPPELYEQWRRSISRLAAVTSLVSGLGLFQVCAILVMVAYIQRVRRGRRILEQWAEEEANSYDDEPVRPDEAEWKDWEDEEDEEDPE